MYYRGKPELSVVMYQVTVPTKLFSSVSIERHSNSNSAPSSTKYVVVPLVLVTLNVLGLLLLVTLTAMGGGMARERDMCVLIDRPKCGQLCISLVINVLKIIIILTNTSGHIFIRFKT